MPELEPKVEPTSSRPNYGRAAVALAVLALGVAGVSDYFAMKAKPKAVTTEICQETNPTEWIPVPAGLNVELVAQVLGVSEDNVRAGSIGTAVCNHAISPLDLTRTRITIEGQGDDCVPVGLDTLDGQAPKDDANYKDILAVCAGYAGPTV
jgi:hypothetical protein